MCILGDLLPSFVFLFCKKTFGITNTAMTCIKCIHVVLAYRNFAFNLIVKLSVESLRL
jgi:hypothetical protein